MGEGCWFMNLWEVLWDGSSVAELLWVLWGGLGDWVTMGLNGSQMSVGQRRFAMRYLAKNFLFLIAVLAALTLLNGFAQSSVLSEVGDRLVNI